MSVERVDGGERVAGEMTLLEHLRELRDRLKWASIGVAVALAVCLPFSRVLTRLLLLPAVMADDALERARGGGGSLQLLWTDPRAELPAGFLSALDPSEAFLAILKVGLAAALVLSAPWLLYHLWRFVAPGLYSHERRAILPITFWTTIAFLSGVAFAYFLVLPNGLYFLALQGELLGVENQWRVNSVLKFVTRLPLAFGFVFQLPLAMRFLASLGIISHERFAAGRPVALPLIFMSAAVLTPPDIITQVALAVPMTGLYELGIILAKRVAKQEGSLLPDDDEDEELL